MDFIKDNSRYVLGYNSSKEEIDNFQVHEVVEKIIFEIDRICRKHHIPYALAFGSALGLNNYGDFVPWDDDGDIVIDYFDYDRLVDAFKADLSDEFVFDTEAVNPRYNPLIPHIKVRYKNSFIKEKTRFTLPDRCDNHGIFVDICLFMGVPESKKAHKRLIRKSFMLMPLYVVLDAFMHLNPKCIRKSLRKHEQKVANKYKDSNYVSQSVAIPFQAFPKKYVENLSFPREVIYPFKEYDFLGKKIYSFNDVEEFCRLRYGEKALKKKDKDGNYIDPLSNKEKKSSHLRLIDIYK